MRTADRMAGYPAARYDERLAVPRLWHLWAAGSAAIAGGYAAAYVDGLAAQLPVYLAVFALVEVLMWAAGRARVTVEHDGTLVAAGRRVPAADLADVEILDDFRSALVPGTTAATRGWVRRGVLVRTRGGPDIVLSTRRPGDLTASLGRPAGTARQAEAH